MRKSIQDVRAGRQKVLFGVDKLEMLVADLAVELLRLVHVVGAGNNVVETAHMKRLREHILWLAENSDSQFELGTLEVGDASKE